MIPSDVFMDAGGGLPVFQSANTAAVQQQHIHLHQQQHLQHLQQQQNINLHIQQHQQIHNVQQQQQQNVYHTNSNNNTPSGGGGGGGVVSDTPAKHQAVIDRLRLRMGKYRNRTRDAAPRFDKTFQNDCESQNQDALALQKRMLDSKAKRAKQKINPADKQKQPDSMLNVTNSSVHVVSLYWFYLLIFVTEIIFGFLGI